MPWGMTPKANGPYNNSKGNTCVSVNILILFSVTYVNIYFNNRTYHQKMSIQKN